MGFRKVFSLCLADGVSRLPCFGKTDVMFTQAHTLMLKMMMMMMMVVMAMWWRNLNGCSWKTLNDDYSFVIFSN
jgi:hypothetical protein